MNRQTLSISVIMLSFLFASGNAKAESISEPVESIDSNTLMIRLNELKSINKTALTNHDRKELRQEVRQVRGQLKEPGAGGGIWISILPLLVVIALIIILI